MPLGADVKHADASPTAGRAARTVASMLSRPWVAAALLAALVRLPNLADGLDNDVAIYLTGGFAWAEGDLPYRDLFDHKGPLNAELFLALDWLLPASPVALRLAMFAVFCASLAQFAALLGRHAPAAAWPATVVYAVAASSPLFHGHDFNTEQWALPLAIAAADLADRARLAVGGAAARRAIALAALAGAAIAAATALKSIYLVLAVAVPLALLWRRPRLLAAMAAGGLAALAVILVPYAATGTLDDLADAVLGYSGDFARENLARLSEGGASAIAQYLAEFPDLLLVGLGLVLGVVAFRSPARRRAAAVAGLAALAGWVVARLPGESYAHYFLLPLPGLAALCGLGIAALSDRDPGVRPVLVAIVCLPVVTVLGLAPAHDALGVDRESRWGTTSLPCVGVQAEAAEIVRGLTEPGDRIYVVTGDTTSYFGQQIYWQARRLPASRFIFPRHVVPPAWDEVAAELERESPAAAVLMPEPRLDPVAGLLEDGRLAPAARVECEGGAAIEVLTRPTARVSG